MSTVAPLAANPPRPFALRAAQCLILGALLFPSNSALHAQVTYTTGAGATPIGGNRGNGGAFLGCSNQVDCPFSLARLDDSKSADAEVSPSQPLKKRYLVTRDVGTPSERFEAIDLTEAEAGQLRRNPNTLVDPDGPMEIEPIRPGETKLRTMAFEELGHQQEVGLGLQRMRIPSFPLARINGTNEPLDVDVAVLDSGIDVSHPDLNVVHSFSVYAGDGDSLDHGTKVAGVLGAIDNDFGTVGVAPGVRIWNIQVTGPGQNSWANLISGMDYVRSFSNVISVANISISNSGINAPVPQVRSAMRRLVRAGVVVVVAAGNKAWDLAGPDELYAGNGLGDDAIPAALHEAMAVSAMNPATDTFYELSNYSKVPRPPPPLVLPVPPVPPDYPTSPGGALDVVAPGVGILTTASGGGYFVGEGTSLAAPHVAGLVALYIAANGRAHNEQEVYNIRQAIINASLPQSRWNSSNTLDPDPNPEPLAVPSEIWIPRPSIISVTRTNGDVQLKISSFPEEKLLTGSPGSVPGYDYVIESQDDLNSANWSTVGASSGSGGPLMVTDTNPASSARYYRVRMVPGSASR